MYANAGAPANGGLANYFQGHVLTYTCDANFASTTNPIECTCDTITDPANPMWSCPLDFATTCMRRKFFLLDCSCESWQKTKRSFIKSSILQVGPLRCAYYCACYDAELSLCLEIISLAATNSKRHWNKSKLTYTTKTVWLTTRNQSCNQEKTPPKHLSAF